MQKILSFCALLILVLQACSSDPNAPFLISLDKFEGAYPDYPIHTISQISDNTGSIDSIGISESDSVFRLRYFFHRDTSYKLPDTLFTFRNLQELFIQSDSPILIPPELAQLKNLQILRLQIPGLTEIPEEVFQLPHLNKLMIYNIQDYVSFDEKKDGKVKIYGLEKGLQKLPDSLNQLASLTSLYLSSPDLRRIPDNCTFPPNLQELHLPGCNLRQIPKSIATLSQLEELGISRNQLSALPPEIGELQSLKTLYANENHLRSLPQNFCQLGKLESLVLTQNRLEQLPDCFGELQNLEFINLSSNQFTRLDKIPVLPHLKNLDLEDNQLQYISPQVRHLYNLNQLNLNYNRLHEFPQEIGQLDSLKWFYGKGNFVEELPESFLGLPSIERVNLSDQFFGEEKVKSYNKEFVKRGKEYVINTY